ncbi:MAG: phosphoribosyltransferase [Chloroflexi bacterium AL-W]|nr:phosphoribosyltransferase [Chloroflexi bacterium AL-N1]NOK67760.1 phosphoribosyltransferase [Chloroflexi bacterium AL-N10]NOK75470.1 phosphoribosyltransferase [Chloroflexi bacterium AL-N5]NOK82258.1 phosphoribosyltransferase [Chloroflexi bacterium AL-W]NOK90103.1 phosphoribosyltransferase [Chloroflexi bacterium AL-N15]
MYEPVVETFDMAINPYRFQDRSDAGQQLAHYLVRYAYCPDIVVLALPRGGVPVAFEVACTLHAPLDLLLVRKLGVPGHQELAMGAVASGGICVLNEEVIADFGIPKWLLNSVVDREWQELQRRERTYAVQRSTLVLQGKTIILVDDGLATGMTMQAACRVVRQQDPARVIVAVPVVSYDSCALLAEDVDEFIWIIAPEPLYAIGLWYEDFTQTTDAEVRALLAQMNSTMPQLSPD